MVTGSNIDKALAALENDLAEVSEEQRKGVAPRRVANITLVSIYKFLVAAKFSIGAQGQIVEMVTALEALDAGSVLPLVTPTNVIGNRRVTEGEVIPRAVAAAALHLKFLEFSRLGQAKPLDAAASWVFEKIRDWPAFRYSITAENQKTLDMGRLKKWRTDLRSSCNSPAGTYYNYLILIENNYTAERVLKDEPSHWGFAVK